MKSSKLIFAMAVCMACVFCITACKKKESYVCNCTYANASGTYTDSNELGEKSSMADAETDCNTHQTELLNSGATTATCTVSVK